MTTPQMSPTMNARARAKRETDVAHAAYLTYEGLGAERSYPALVAALKAADPSHYSATDATLLRRVKQWGHDHAWRDRVREYDQTQERKRREKAEGELARMNETQARLAAAAQNKLLASLNDLLDIDQVHINNLKQVQHLAAQRLPIPDDLYMYTAPKPPRLMVSSATRAELWRNMIDVERLARGAATENIQQQFAGGVRIHVTTATADGQDRPSPFGFDPNLLMRLDDAGATGNEDDETDEGDVVDAEPGTPDRPDGPGAAS